MIEIASYTWRMLESPGMFDMRGNGEYARAIEAALCEGVICLEDVRAHRRDLKMSQTVADLLAEWRDLDYEAFLTMSFSRRKKVLPRDIVEALAMSARGLYGRWYAPLARRDRDEVAFLRDVRSCAVLSGFSCAGSGQVVPAETVELYCGLWRELIVRSGSGRLFVFSPASGALGRAGGDELNSFAAPFCQAMGVSWRGSGGGFEAAWQEYRSLDPDGRLASDLQMLALLSSTAGNFLPVPRNAVCLPGEGGGKSIQSMHHGLQERADQLLAVIYRWVMGLREPDGPGSEVRARLESDCDVVARRCASLGELGDGEAGAVGMWGNHLARWVCGNAPLGSKVDRQQRWDRFVANNFLHDYVGPSRYGGMFGPPVEYSPDVRRRVVEMSARIIARGNRMRNAARAYGIDGAVIDRVFGD